MQEDEIQLIAAKGEYVALFGFCTASILLVAYLLRAQLVTPWVTVALPLLVGALLFGGKKLLQTQPEYTLDQQGIRFGPSWGHGWIPWAAVTAIEAKTELGCPPYVALRLRADAVHWPTPRAWRQRLLQIMTGQRESHPTAYLYTAGLTVSHDQVLTILHRFWQHQKEIA